MARLVTPSVPIEKSSIIQSQRNFNFSSQNLLPKIDGLNFTRAPRKIPLSISRETSEVPINSAPPKAANPIIVIDNYDSFTYNLCQYMGELGCDFEVYRNDELTVNELKRKNPRGVLISPGPGTPQDSGISLQTVLELGPSVPLFGVCMGLQCMGEAFGGKIVRSPYGVMHGKSSLVYYNEAGEEGILAGLSNPFTAGRYHSLVIEKETFPHDALEITAWTEDGLVMAARHKVYKHLQENGICTCKVSITNQHSSFRESNFIQKASSLLKAKLSSVILSN
ncbi:anthranilate synthase beta subunit 2, chloroplastic-like isoform X1 [Olea europaea var. sylvestris]|uniref:anthranilate synthase beta subunit 2, chloroplastic-like isoform X1 n=1 Tax=Olea europaea var. sylvestris TaxID=158386 RepID=UPI000C1D3D85|nr:anthranilate synthase beta subunit 2, chloroplastic-like isoform X1 [Olea europaea var. sylvestris]